MTSVVYWNNIPAPYMVERFNATARRGSLAFEAWFSARTEPGRSWRVNEETWEFPYRFLPSIGHGANVFAVPTPLLRANVPDLLVSLYASPSFLLGWALARQRGARTAFWVEVTYDAWVTRRRWKESMKSRLFPRADAILTAGTDGCLFARRYGAEEGRIFAIPHVIDFDYYSKRSNLSVAERTRVRGDLGLHGVTFVYVGRLWLGKGLAFLIDAFRTIQRPDVGETTLLLVGDGPDEDVLRTKAAGAGCIVFAGFHHPETLASLYAASDVFVFPTLGDPFGLVVLEAMASGLPVIATTASGEIRDRVVEGVNGFLVPPANVEQLANRMTVLAQDSNLRKRMAEASARKVTGQTPDLWAKAFEGTVERILRLPRSPGGGVTQKDSYTRTSRLDG
jgi:glycosyltransferase involved in cell wall biosynthesis